MTQQDDITQRVLVDYEVYQEDELVASSNSLAHAEQYAEQYGQDGRPVEMMTCIRIDGFHAVETALLSQVRAPVADERASVRHASGRQYHVLKTDPEVFQAVLSGAKTFEIRLNDRGYGVGDVLGLRETKHTGAEMRAGAPLVYTGRECQRFVSHVLTGYGIADGWCCLSFELPHAGGASAPVADEPAKPRPPMLRIPGVCEDVLRRAAERIVGAPVAGEAKNYPGDNVAERLDKMADGQPPGSQAQSDLYAAATIWRKHIAHRAAPQASAEDEWKAAIRKFMDTAIPALAAIANVHTPDEIDALEAMPREPVIDQVRRLSQACEELSRQVRPERPKADKGGGQQRAGEVLFWYRPRSDGWYEGPIHNDRIEEARKVSGVWVPLVAAPQASAEAFDFVAHLARQAEFSVRTFGPGARVAGVCDHIRKELIEVETSGGDLKEWVDVIILGLDGAWRSGATPQEIIAAIVAKQAKNEARTWPDWRTVDPTKAIEHDRGGQP